MANPEHICVGCAEPLRRGQVFGVRRGRFWHHHCYTLFEGQSVEEQKMHRALGRKEVEVAEAEVSRQRLRIEADTQRRRAERLESELAAERVIVSRLRQELAIARENGVRVANNLAQAQGAVANLQREMAASRIIAAATPAAPAPAPAPTDPTPDTANADTKDGTEMRFSLLELE